MKRYIILALGLICALGLTAWGLFRPIDTTSPVFETEGLHRITLYRIPDHMDGVEVPEEDMAEMTAWIGTFTLDRRAGGALAPGANSVSFRLEYADGTVVENGISTITMDGVSYYLSADNAPDCFLALLGAYD